MATGGRARNGSLAIAALCSVQFADVLGVTVVVTALPRMLADLRAPASSASLVAGGYALFFSGLLMLGARLGDRFGHRRVIIASLAVLAGGSAGRAGTMLLASGPAGAPGRRGSSRNQPQALPWASPHW
jgi:MFS family permease